MKMRVSHSRTSGKYPRVRTQLVNATIPGHSRGNLEITHLHACSVFLGSRSSMLGPRCLRFKVCRSRM